MMPLLTVAAWPFIAVGLMCVAMAAITRSGYIVLSLIGVVCVIGGIIQIFAGGPKVHLG